jgi:hypothetical protein
VSEEKPPTEEVPANVTKLPTKSKDELEEERRAQEEAIKAHVEMVAQQNKMVIEANQKAAIDWLKDNKGQGVMLAMDPDGKVHTWVVGNADVITQSEPKVDSNLFNMLMLLVGTHLPGSSVQAHIQHQELSDSLQAIQHNMGVLVSYLQLKDPNLRVSATDLKGNPIEPESKLIVPK